MYTQIASLLLIYKQPQFLLLLLIQTECPTCLSRGTVFQCRNKCGDNATSAFRFDFTLRQQKPRKRETLLKMSNVFLKFDPKSNLKMFLKEQL